MQEGCCVGSGDAGGRWYSGARLAMDWEVDEES